MFFHSDDVIKYAGMKDSVIVLPEASPYYWSIGLDTIDTNIIEPDLYIGN